MSSCWAKVPWIGIMQVLGCLGGVAVMVIGVVRMMDEYDRPKDIIANIYRVFFGALILVSEFRVHGLLNQFTFLKTYFGRGVFYLFVGSLGLGSEWYEVAIGIIMAAVGVGFMLVQCCGGGDGNTEPDASGKYSTTATTAQP